MEILNRKANYDYLITDTFEAGLVLTGTEIKSVRNGKVNIKDSYAIIKNDEMYLLNTHISIYEEGNIFNHDEKRDRKLLAHKKEIRKLAQKVKLDGITIVPLQVYLKGVLCKLKIALARGKKKYDKREDMKQNDAKKMIKNMTKKRDY